MSSARLRAYGLPDGSFDAVNLLGRWPGSAGKGSRFPRCDHTLASIAGGRRALLLGRRVAASVGCGRVPYLRWVDVGGVEAAVVPHPSGVNRWWNDPANREAARLFFEDALRCVGWEELPPRS